MNKIKNKINRDIIVINENRCDGCGLCITSCQEGALQIVNTPNGPKARLIREDFCDGLGACLGDCPQNALSIEKKEVDPFEENIIEEHTKHNQHHGHNHSITHGFSCPSSKIIEFKQEKYPDDNSQESDIKIKSQLRQWPVQLHLLPPTAPFFKNSDLVLVADCVCVAYPNFHIDIIKGKSIAIACPKLDNTESYIEKLIGIIDKGLIKSLTVYYMEVPCCGGLVMLASEAIKNSKREIPFNSVIIKIKN